MDVRAATVADALAIETIRVRGWQATYRHVFPPEELDGLPVDESRWRRRRVAEPPPGWAVVVAEDRGAVVGFAATGPSRDEDGIGELYAIYVEPSRWSAGTGRALLARAEHELARGHAEATLWVLEANDRARRFYKRAGWLPDGAAKEAEHLGVRAPELRYRKALTVSDTVKKM